MIVYKNKLEEISENHNDHIEFRVNDTNMHLTKNYGKIRNILLSHAAENEKQKQHQIIEIKIPDLTIFYTIKYNDEFFSYSNNSGSFNSYVLHSNFDGRDDKEDDKTENRIFFKILHNMLNRKNKIQSNDNYYNNKITNPSQVGLFSLKSDTRRMIYNSIISLKQFQFLLDGYDIIIPDFIIDDMIKIAEKFVIEDLIEELKRFKNEIEDIENYHRFSELEILIKLNEILKKIDENNFHDNISLIYSIFEYTGSDLFEQILNHFISIYPQKNNVYSNICKMIGSKLQNKFDNKRDDEPKKDDLCDIISNDDIDSLQKQLCNPVLDISKISFNLEKRKCNLIECAAFFGSIKCFKYLLLNTELNTNNVSKLAIIGGNIEIVRICQQKKFDFYDTLSVAIKYHQNDIAKWIFENKIDNDSLMATNFIRTCIHECNYEMLSYFLDIEIQEIPKEKQIFIKFLLYALQYYHIDICEFNSFSYFISKYKSIKLNNEDGLIYCPIGKIEIIGNFIDSLFNDYHNEDVFTKIILLMQLNNHLFLLLIIMI